MRPADEIADDIIDKNYFRGDDGMEVSEWGLKDDIAQAIRDAREEAGWRDISTAPKDGTPILALVPGSQPDDVPVMTTVKWAKDSGKWNGCAFEGGWDLVMAWGYEAELTPWAPPTHWRPLPPPPKE